ncbi:MAG: glutathione S-transferase [Myxococcales bacterium]|nr:glutathione S-transferase [Myxococcales bacterium]
MKFYESIGPNPRLVRMFAAEKDFDLPDRVQIDIIAGENRKQPYVSLNPRGQMPALELDDGTVLSETIVLCEYIEELKPTPVLIGTTPEERAITRMWTRRVEQAIVAPITDGFRYAEGLPLFKDRMRVIPEAADGLKAIARDGLQWLDGELSGREYISPNGFGMADIVLYAFLEFGASVGQALDPALKNLNEWYARVSARPSVEATANPGS